MGTGRLGPGRRTAEEVVGVVVVVGLFSAAVEVLDELKYEVMVLGPVGSIGLGFPISVGVIFEILERFVKGRR